MAKSKMKEPDKTEDGLLTKLYRDVLIKSGRINKIKDDVATYKTNGGTRAVGSILKDINDGSITWKSFLFLLLKVHRVKIIEFNLKVYYSDKKDDYTEHQLVVKPKASLIDKKSKKDRIIKDD